MDGSSLGPAENAIEPASEHPHIEMIPLAMHGCDTSMQTDAAT